MKSYQDFLTLIEKRIEHERNIKSHPPEEGELIPEGSTDYNMMDIDGNSLIHYAIKEGKLEAVKDLIENKNVALYRKDLHPLVTEHLPFGSKTEIYLPKEVIIYAINSNAQPQIANDEILPSKLSLPDVQAFPKLSSNKATLFNPAPKIANDAVMPENVEKKSQKRE
jgi:ankyrin repeat protein